MTENRPTIKGLLFDKDGTLILFEESWRPVILDVVDRLSNGNKALGTRMLEAAGYDTETDTFVAGGLLAGGTEAQVLDCWFGFVQKPSDAELAALKQHMLDTQIVVPVDGLKTRLERWGQEGYALGVATNDTEITAKANLKQLGIDHLFTFVAGADSSFGAKPGTGMLSAFCKASGLMPSEVAMVGDNWQDMQMARDGKAGIAVGVLTGTTTADELANLADVVLPSIADLDAVLDTVLDARI